MDTLSLYKPTQNWPTRPDVIKNVENRRNKLMQPLTIGKHKASFIFLCM